MQEQVKEPAEGLEENPLSMTINQAPYKIESYGLSDVGLCRQNNEDAWNQLPAIGFYLLADGMGGHQAGEVAAKEAVDTMCRLLKRKFPSIKKGSIQEACDVVARAMIHVNKVVYKMGRSHSDFRGMGTTLCCLLFHKEEVILAHVGDSRIYRLRGNRLEQMTKDHSLFCELVDQGQLTREQASDFLYKNIITKAIGTEPALEPSVQYEKIQTGDLYLLCSDGLSDLLTQADMTSILKQFPSPEAAAKMLVKRAIDLGGRDNVTVLVAKIEGL